MASLTWGEDDPEDVVVLEGGGKTQGPHDLHQRQHDLMALKEGVREVTLTGS